MEITPALVNNQGQAGQISGPISDYNNNCKENCSNGSFKLSCRAAHGKSFRWSFAWLQHGPRPMTGIRLATMESFLARRLQAFRKSSWI